MNKGKRSNEVRTLHSLEDLRAEFSLPPLRMQTKDKGKLKSQRENFINRHKCPICGNLLTYVNETNVMVCQSKDCKGVIKTEYYDEETGEKVTCHMPYCETLDEHSAKIARNIFAELD